MSCTCLRHFSLDFMSHDGLSAVTKYHARNEEQDLQISIIYEPSLF